MIGSLPPYTNQQIIELLEGSIKYEKILNEKLRQEVKDQKAIVKALDEYIRDNI